jgi:hypothetical protein
MGGKSFAIILAATAIALTAGAAHAAGGEDIALRGNGARRGGLLPSVMGRKARAEHGR